MIKMLKYNGYEEDGVEGYQCLNCHNSISLRHHAFTITLDYCPFCGCKFEGGFIKDNKYKFYKKTNDGYFRSEMYKIIEREYRQQWIVEKFSTTYWSFGDIHDVTRAKHWEEVYAYNFDYDTKKSEREIALLQMQRDMENELNEVMFGGDKEVIEYRLKYCKYYHSGPYKERCRDIKYYYPKKNTIVKIANQRKKSYQK